MLKKNSILAIIPARGGSKGIPGKNLKKICGKTLLARTIESAQASRYIDRLIVSSEDLEILEEARKFGDNVPFVRPKELAQDDTPGIAPILHAIENLESYDYVIVLQVTSPMRITKDIDCCIEHCLSLAAPACVSVVEVDKHPLWMVNMDDKHELTSFCSEKAPARRQDLPKTYAINGAIYIAKSSWLLKKQDFLSEGTIGFEMPFERSIDIDTEMDLNFAQWMLEHNALKQDVSLA